MKWLTRDLLLRRFWTRLFRTEPSYDEYQCPICGFDRVLTPEEDMWICQHCGRRDSRVGKT